MYLRFYRNLVAFRHDVIVAPFSVVVSAFGSVIREMNEKFGTHFEEFTNTEENVRRVFDSVEARGWRDSLVRNRDYEIGVARPSAERQPVKDALREQYASPVQEDLRLEAEALYEAYVEDG
jgi:hypothetical protein